MHQTLHWFGPKDLTSIDDMMQAGVDGVISALHHLPTGAIWSPEAIAGRHADRADEGRDALNPSVGRR